MSTQTLVAMDWDNAGLSTAAIERYLGPALVAQEETTTPHFRDGHPITTHRFTFDARKARNTEVHGVAFHAGFVAHVE